MANELNIALPTSGLTVTAQRYQSGSAVGSAISLTEVGSSGFYTGTMTGTAGTYQLAFISAGANVGSGSIVWSGTAEVPASTFNPSTDTVSNVTLCATTTTLTNAPAVPTVVAIRQELDANSTKLANLDATISSRLADADYVSAPSVSDIRAELAVELGRLDASVSSRLAGSSYTAPTTPPTAAEITTAVWASADKTGYSLTSAERTAIAAAVESSILNEADGQAVLNAIVGAIGNTNLSEVSLVAAVRADLERTGGKLDSIPTTSAPSASTVAGAVWSAAARTVTGGTVDNLTNAPASVTPSDIWSHTTRTLTSGGAPSVVQIRQEMDANSTKLANLDAPVSGATAPSAATVASAVRAELTEISRLDVAVSSRMAGSEATKLDAVKAKTDALNTDRLAQCATTQIVGSLIAQANS